MGVSTRPSERRTQDFEKTTSSTSVSPVMCPWIWLASARPLFFGFTHQLLIYRHPHKNNEFTSFPWQAKNKKAPVQHILYNNIRKRQTSPTCRCGSALFSCPHLLIMVQWSTEVLSTFSNGGALCASNFPIAFAGIVKGKATLKKLSPGYDPAVLFLVLNLRWPFGHKLLEPGKVEGEPIQ